MPDIATTTTNLGLRKPAPTDNVNVTTDISNNMDTIDTAVAGKAASGHTHAYEATGTVAAHEADTTSVHGITDTTALETTTGSAAKVAAHEADTTSVHGIADTTALATSGAVTSAVSTHAGLGDPHPGYVLESLIDAAGDLVVGTADNTVGRLAKGSALQVLRVNAGATALEYADPAASSGTSVSVVAATRSSGNITINGTSWANVDTGLDLVIAAVATDWLAVSISGRLAAGAANTHTYFDIATIVSAAPVNYFGAGGVSDEGLNGLRVQDAQDSPLTGTFLYQVQAGDVSGGNVTLRLRTAQGVAGNRVFVAGSPNPFKWWVANLG